MLHWSRLPQAGAILLVTAAIAIGGAGCRSAANPFVHMRPDYQELPVEAMRALALDIETAVQEGLRDAEFADRDGLVLNEEVRLAIRTRAARSALVNVFRDSGFAFENRKGLIEIIRSKEYKRSGTSRDRDRNAILVMGENENRWAIYEGILKGSSFPARALSAIQEIFQEARVQVMPAGQLYEDASGNRVRKQ
ncbi:MAG TPA: hypothetical protein PKI11_06720 [Candidatus Hydrogenedentes bacterium]|nr:hypothetical protein [Candidatus Hydrogenedentota bacterium]